MKKETYGTVVIEEIEYTIIQNPYNESMSGEYWEALAVKTEDLDAEEAQEYDILWEETSDFQKSKKLYNLELFVEDCKSHNEDCETEKKEIEELISQGICGDFCCEAENACDWDNPYEINKI